MNVQEAIEIVTNAIQTDTMTVEWDKALAVVQRAVDKQIAERPELWGDGYADGELVYDMYSCPNCGKSYEIDETYDYCPNCGKKIDWSEAGE